MSPRKHPKHPERSAVTPVMVAVLAIAVLVAMAVARLGAAAIAAERAQAVADAAVLAAAVGGSSAAQTVAVANGAEVVAVSGDPYPGSTWVTQIRLGRATASAAAQAVAPGP